MKVSQGVRMESMANTNATSNSNSAEENYFVIVYIGYFNYAHVIITVGNGDLSVVNL
jgi:hypothetical protein